MAAKMRAMAGPIQILYPTPINRLGWSGWAVRGSAWRRTDLNGEKGCRCADPVLFL